MLTHELCLIVTDCVFLAAKTRDNTSANTGDAHPVGHNAAHDKGDGQKEGLVDKLKDKLHMSHKDKAAS